VPLPAFTQSGDLPPGIHRVTFDADTLTGEARLLFDHASAQAHFGASVFWLRRLAEKKRLWGTGRSSVMAACGELWRSFRSQYDC
jgi:hypothetical protein